MVAGNSTLAVAASGTSITVTLGGSTVSAWPTVPSVGDTLIIPANTEYGASGDSAVKGSASANIGIYVVTAATDTTIVATKLRNNSGTSVTSPVNVTATDAIAITDVLVYGSINTFNATGANRNALTGLGGYTITGTASGSSLTLTLETGQQWAALAQVGDLVQIPSTAPAAWHASGANGGWYQVTSATSSTAAAGSKIVMTRLSNGSPASFVATAIAAVSDLVVLKPVIDGFGKSLEFYDGAGAESVSSPGILYNLSATAVTWVSTGGTPVLLTSASEYTSSTALGRQSDGISETIAGNGDVVLKVGYHGGGTSTVQCSLTISGTTLTTTVTGGTGSNLSVDLTQFKTVGDLAAYLNSQTGYTAAATTALYGQNALIYKDAANAYQTVLDKGTYTIASPNTAYAGRLKKEAFAWFKTLSDTSILAQLGTTTTASATAGQPEVKALFFLSGGTRGSTTNARVTGAIDAMQKVRGNFLVTLFSRDASDDITDNLTSSSSTYTIDSINAYAKSHVLAMSAVKARRPRQGYVSKKTSFTNAKLAANDLASAKMSLTFQDFKFVDSTGTIAQFQPWAGAVAAAAMQAAGFYRSIAKKFINCSGVIMADGSFSDQVASQEEDALKNGLLPAERAETGGFRWISDQTTYAVDNNFAYNSSQAMYAIDIIGQTISQRMENAFVGQSLADVTAGVMLSFLQSIMEDLKKQKLIASSDEAPLGYRNASIRISGGAAVVQLEIKLATSIYFIPVTAYFTQVQSSASL